MVLKEAFNVEYIEFISIQFSARSQSLGRIAASFKD